MNTSQQSTWNTMPFLLLRLSRRRHQVQQLKRQLIVTEPPLDFISALATFGRHRIHHELSTHLPQQPSGNPYPTHFHHHIFHPTAYALFWSLLILAIRGFYSVFIHPAIYITFGLIAFGTILGCCAAKLHFVTSYGSQYSCDRRYSGTCNIYSMQLRVMEYFGCVVGFGLFVWACSVCSKRVRGVQKG
ncbi:uncharacterized protein EURHEDRAFT_130839 [Aspergillus ruber CBS 135680]|uniref:Uncharacterized protein n=1 Tax=Aspergillus ruber (strain CBS 135680) TaxID=1388766 RepID=A0A017SQU8_ASPRC|nr:uncharacterized protein EURHEDRAFT_130839 [Aspergillus ruber CBS 135680]EYE99181.1 hypothetical protein EURHEDRAFT_130839 [Aspergillus ruber CBS 135680]